MHPIRSFVFTLMIVGTAGDLGAQIDARILQMPDVSETHIAFVYAGDIWTVPKAGGTATRLSTALGQEELPRFSPDGRHIAFTANYDGNLDVYVMPSGGGEPVRLTHHPWYDRMIDWYPDGSGLLFASRRESGITRFMQLYRTGPAGGLPEKLPLPYGEFAAISPDARQLAFMPQEQDFSTWKRYRGGDSPDIWLFDLESLESRKLTDDPANDSQPMWSGRTIYFMSDRGPHQRNNIWAYDLDSESLRQVTHFEDFDIHFPALGPSDIVFEAGGRLYLLELAAEEYRPIDVSVVTDRASLRPRAQAVADLIMSAAISPSGVRAAFEARGELFTVPAEHGVIRNLTRSSGFAERYPAWSPDGRQIAYWSDGSGEYELTIRPADGTGEEQMLTSLGPGYRYRIHWSPDSRRLAFIDETCAIRVHERDAGESSVIDRCDWMSDGALSGFTVSWSSDSRWLAYAKSLPNNNRAIFLYDTRSGERYQVTSGFYDDFHPVFDPSGEYLYLYSNRNFDITFSDIQFSWIFPNATVVAAVPLRSDVPSPLAPRNEEEEPGDEEEKEEDSEDEAGEGESAGVEIDLTGFERRLVVLPPEPGNFRGLGAVKGKVVYVRRPRTGSNEEEGELVYYDLEEREEKVVLENVDAFALAAGKEKALVVLDRRYAIIDVKAGQEFETLRTRELEMVVDPREEWRQLFADAWRFQRDFFYDPGLHGVDWEAMRERYSRLLEHAVTRWDVNFVIGELIGELNASHTYRFGGDTESPESRSVGMLGADWALENGAFRIARIVEGAPWDTEFRSPLRAPGVDIDEGDYVLAVNGVTLDTSRDPWASFQGLAGQTVSLTVNDRPSPDGAREVLVEPLSSEGSLRYRAWVEANRRHVEEVTDGRIGYIHVPNTASWGHTELVRMFAAQTDKQGLIIDERFNSGGYLPDRMVELLGRRPLNFQARRHGPDATWPRLSNHGPKVMLINGWAGSGGDAFPEYFRKAGLGPLIGTRTWGGRIGLTGSPDLIDGGTVTVPTYRNYDPGGGWFAEGHGVDPDIVVEEDPTQLARGIDPQLERAIAEVLRMLEESPPIRPDRPPYEKRIATDPDAERRTSDGGGQP